MLKYNTIIKSKTLKDFTDDKNIFEHNYHPISEYKVFIAPLKLKKKIPSY